LNYLPPFHFPEVKGWVALVDRAQAKMFFSKGKLAEK
jgi:hypothetical protein